MEYQRSIPYSFWSFPPEQFKEAVRNYIERMEPGMKPIRIHRPYWIICEKE
jgi:hypothetical protein